MVGWSPAPSNCAHCARNTQKLGFSRCQLTDAIKDEILGPNAAKLFGIDVKAARKVIEADKLSRIWEEYQKNSRPTNTQYGWVWLDNSDGKAPNIPVGNG